MSEPRDVRDVKDVMIAGCAVHLAFRPIDDGLWTVQGTVRCGIEERASEQSFNTAPCATREAAEEEAFRRAKRLLGNNVDRSTSRVRTRDR